jgi:hypothetical protein
MINIKDISDVLRTRPGSSIIEEWGDRVKTREHYFSLRNERDAEIMQIDQTVFGALAPTVREYEKGDDYRRYRAIP